ncbi:undecaprenyl diphosphate synthase [Cerasibacillus quisquiliarum]|uniref:Isoprenyl transferase n=1 Tax=Cerasibacillus quisquiliarum TaxID=227865 RepID=A0A511UV33_9BACI|nr:isoprenyl transferase [Cerasibacillus quisquiliarum]MBB5145889.1 undecaprenyl diphosphate synthase [Cerasibacillus quisquiliarum]GEN30460.1 isoprenyl transferase [Cerasibacillus quisquiliarum]
MSIRLPFLKKKDREQLYKVDQLKNIPFHVAIIMDGNGRWAKRRGFPRVAGHKEGMEATQRAVRAATKFNVKILTLFAFSTENWKRPTSEVDFLMRLPKEYLHIYLPELLEKNVRIDTIGDLAHLPKHTREAVESAKEQSKDNDGMLLNFAINYGSRLEIVRAVKQLVKDYQDNDMMNKIADLDEDIFSKYLYTNGLNDPDLLIRTSGEQRLSNFLLWQCAYSEFYFTDVLWPDFTEEVFYNALLDYQKRKRRYGGI